MTNRKALDDRIKGALEASVLTNKTTRELVQEWNSNGSLSVFLAGLSKEPNLKKFLFLHRLDMFGEDGPIMPHIQLCGPPSPAKPTDHVYDSKAFTHIVATEVLPIKEKEVRELLGLDETKWTGLLEDLKDVVVYLVILFLRENPKIQSLARGKDFDYSMMKQSLKDYSDTIHFDELVETIESIFSQEGGQIEPIVRNKVENLIVTLVSGVAKVGLDTIAKRAKLVPDLFMSIHESSSSWQSRILSLTGFSYQEYLEILDTLHQHGLLWNMSTISWCGNCSMEGLTYVRLYGNITPSKLMRIKCLNCNKRQSFRSIFALNETLRGSILSKDGFLSVYLGWLLTRENIGFEPSKYSTEFESDFVVRKAILVECKTFKSQKDTVAIGSEIKNALTQVSKQIKELKEDRIKIRKAYILWNRTEKEAEIQDKFRGKFAKVYERYGLEIVCPNDIEKMVESIKMSDFSD
jgi:hypothetical protein